MFVMSISGLSLAHAGDKEIQMYIGSKASGRIAANSAIISDELKKLGYKVDYKLLGNCAPVKEMIEKGSDKTLVTVWMNLFQAGDTCHIEVKKEQFVGTVWVNPYWFCTRETQGGWKWQPGKTYKVATHPADGNDKVLSALGKILNVNLESVQYKNSGAIKKAFVSKEVDVVFASIGPELMADKSASCPYNTADQEYMGGKPLYPLLGGKVINARASAIVWVAVNSKLSPEDTKKLYQDIQKILAGNAILTAIKNQGSYQLNGSIESQIEAVDIFTQAIK